MLSSAPELIDVTMKLPRLLTSGVGYLEEAMNETRPPDPMNGLRSGILAGACIIGGVLSAVQGGALWLTGILFGLGGMLALFGK
jgi:ubiquinone biosynthesis protein